MSFGSLSLKWKIAAWYAALVVAALAMTSGIVLWRFDNIVYAQARERADATMNQMLSVANPAPFGLQGTGSGATALQVLLNSDNLVYWSSPETSIEIDQSRHSNPNALNRYCGAEAILSASGYYKRLERSAKLTSFCYAIDRKGSFRER